MGDPDGCFNMAAAVAVFLALASCCEGVRGTAWKHVFSEVTADVLHPDMFEARHMGSLKGHFNAPVFQDLNGDGVLDLFTANHAVNVADWDLALGQMQASGLPRYQSALKNLTTWMDEPLDGNDDFHASAFADIDGDSLMDLFVTTGASRGTSTLPKSDSIVLWGDGTASEPHFVGGRRAARDASINGNGGRARFAYVLDANRDGLPDIFLANLARNDDLNYPGELRINQGGRWFAMDTGMREYVETMVVHDVNMDRVADEVVMLRAACAPGSVNECFCSTRTEGSLGVFRWSSLLRRMVEAPQDFGELAPGSKSIQRGDFDGDGFVDLVMSKDKELWFFLSSNRTANYSLQLGEPERVDMDRSVNIIRVADFDLDGTDDMLVIWKLVPGRDMHDFSLFTQSETGWEEVAASAEGQGLTLGDLGNQVPHMCEQEGLPGSKIWTCNQEDGPGDKPVHPKGISIVDFNNDGFQDVVIAYSAGPVLFYMNNLASVGHTFLHVRLLASNGTAGTMGATVTLEASQMGANNATTVQVRELTSAGCDGDMMGSRDERIVFGLGARGVPLSLNVYWPPPSKAVSTIGAELLAAHVLGSMEEPLVVYQSSA